jgi:hypothetical protein
MSYTPGIFVDLNASSRRTSAGYYNLIVTYLALPDAKNACEYFEEGQIHEMTFRGDAHATTCIVPGLRGTTIDSIAWKQYGVAWHVVLGRSNSKVKPYPMSLLLKAVSRWRQTNAPLHPGRAVRNSSTYVPDPAFSKLGRK